MSSKLSIYSIGVIAKDKEPSSWDVEVYPIELLPDTSVNIGEEVEENIDVTDAFGNEINVVTKTTSTVTATWLPMFNSNRSSAPDVCKGETVLLYRLDGNDKYYWIELFFQPRLRKYETVQRFYSNKDSIIGDDDLSSLREKGYYSLVDTLNKQVKFHTANNDGETVAYDLVINTADGITTYTDSKNNYVTLDSENDKLTVNIGKNIEVTVSEQVTINLDKFAVQNSTVELIDWLCQLVQAIIAEQHIGNLGAATMLTPDSISTYQNLLSKMQTMKQ